MTFKGYIRRVYVLHIETKIHTEPLIQYVCSSIKYPYTLNTLTPFSLSDRARGARLLVLNFLRDLGRPRRLRFRPSVAQVDAGSDRRDPHGSPVRCPSRNNTVHAVDAVTR